jgi:hypothetical protein
MEWKKFRKNTVDSAGKNDYTLFSGKLFSVE